MRFRLPALILSCCIYLTGCNSNPAVELDSIFRDYNGLSPGAALRVLRNSKPILTRTYGYASLSPQTAITENTNFRLASISKHFTALAILMLVQDNKLHLETTLTAIFDAFPNYGEDITVEQLLQHRSGLLDYEPLVSTDTQQQLSDQDVLELMTQQSSTYFPPGTLYRYSNSGYAVLAMIVEQLSGLPFYEFLSQKIFQPNNLDGTVAYINGVNSVADRAFGYVVSNGKTESSDQSLYSAVLGDGGIYSSLADLTRWHGHNYGSQLISPVLSQKTLTAGPGNYGFGWRIDTYQGHRRVHHSGSTSGFRHFIARFPDENLAIILLTNRAGPDVQPLAEKVLTLFLKPKS